jgi:hypothetical protein
MRQYNYKEETMMRIKKIIFTFLFLILISEISYSQITLTLPNVSGAPGTTVVSPINVSDLTGLQITSYQFELKFDPNVIVIDTVFTSGTLTNSVPTIKVDPIKGKFRIAWASGSPISGSGTLINIHIKFKNIGTTSIKYIASDTITSTIIFNSQFYSDPNSNSVPVNSIDGSATTSSGSNIPPSLNMNPPGPYSIGEGSTLTATLVGSDPDPGDVLAYSYTSTPTMTGATINSATGAFSWTPVTNQFGIYNVTFSVSDGKATTPVTTTITVTKTNLPPILSLNPTGPYSVNAGTDLKVTLVGSDPNTGDVLTYSYSATPTITGATLGQSTGLFDWTPTSNQSGIYSVTFSVTDGKVITSITTSITVNNVNLSPTLLLAPPGPYLVDEGQKLTFTLQGSDPNAGDVLTYSITAPVILPAGAQLTGNQFSWTPNYNQSSTTPYNFTFKVTDQGGLSASISGLVYVNNVDRAPIFTKELPDNVVVPVNTPSPFNYTFQYSAVDPDSDKIVFSLINGPDGSSVSLTGLFSWSPTVSQAEKSYTLTVQASDGIHSVQSTHIIFAGKVVGVQKISEIPTEYTLCQNFPNPFNPTTSIRFAVPKESFIKLSVFNVLGQEIMNLVNKVYSPGNYQVSFDASKLNSGIYFYQIKSMMVLK